MRVWPFVSTFCFVWLPRPLSRRFVSHFFISSFASPLCPLFSHLNVLFDFSTFHLAFIRRPYPRHDPARSRCLRPRAVRELYEAVQAAIDHGHSGPVPAFNGHYNFSLENDLWPAIDLDQWSGPLESLSQPLRGYITMCRGLGWRPELARPASLHELCA